MKDEKGTTMDGETASGAVSVDIYDQVYHLRGIDPDYIEKLAALVDSKKLAALTALALTIATTSAFAETLTGYVADAMCAKDPHKVSTADHADCAKKCIGMGEKPVLVVDEKIVYTVTNPDMLTKHAGEKVTVDGTVKDGALTVKSVK